MNGGQSWFYAFTSNETLRIYTPAGLANGFYRVDVYVFEYNKLIIHNSIFDVAK